MRVRDVAPSAVTLVGLLLAFWSVTLAQDGRIGAAVWVAFAAAVADIVDGAVARGFGLITPFGKQLDSLVDLVAAGVAPAFIVYRVYFEGWGFWGVLVGFGWVALVAIRLARFNTAGLVDGPFFVGVPCPIAATLVAQYVVFSRATFGDDGEAWVSLAMIVVLGALMLSDVPYWKSSTLMPRAFFRHTYGVGFTVTMLLTALMPQQGIFIGVGFSVVGATVFHVMHSMGVAPLRPTSSLPEGGPA